MLFVEIEIGRLMADSNCFIYATLQRCHSSGRPFRGHPFCRGWDARRVGLIISFPTPSLSAPTSAVLLLLLLYARCCCLPSPTTQAVQSAPPASLCYAPRAPHSLLRAAQLPQRLRGQCLHLSVLGRTDRQRNCRLQPRHGLVAGRGAGVGEGWVCEHGMRKELALQSVTVCIALVAS